MYQTCVFPRLTISNIVTMAFKLRPHIPCCEAFYVPVIPHNHVYTTQPLVHVIQQVCSRRRYRSLTGHQSHSMCSDRAHGIVYYGYWLGTVVKIVHETVCRRWFGLSRELLWLITAFTGGGLQWWHEHSGSWACVLEEDGRVLYLLDKEALFVVVKYMYIQEFM